MLRKGKSTGAPLVERIAAASVRHRAVAIGGWFALVCLAVLASALVTGNGAPSQDPGETGRAERVLNSQHSYDPERESVLVTARHPGAARFSDNPELIATTADLVSTLRRTGAAAEIRSPATTGGADRVSADGRSGLVTFRIAGPVELVSDHFEATVAAVAKVAARHGTARLSQSGDMTLSRAVDSQVKSDLSRSELTSLPVTLIILLIVFGSLVAAGIPILLTLTTMVAAMSLLQVVDHWIPINSAASSMLLLIGVAVGVDYSLFYLRRVREEHAAGRGLAGALRVAARTSGRVIVVSGLTVMLCLLGLLFTGIGQFRGLAIGTILVVGLAVVGSVTVLPALLATLGGWVDRGRIPWLGRRRTTASRSRTWSAVARAVVDRPLAWGGIAALALIVLATPMIGIRFQDAAPVNSLPRSVPAVDAAIRMQQAFPGTPTPTKVAIWRPDGAPVDSAAVRKALDGLRGQVAGSHGALGAPIAVARVERIIVVRVPLAGSGTDAASDRALETLRDKALPATVGQVPGVSYAVAGRTAFAHDFVSRLTARTPYVVGFVLALAFVLLLLAFRSLTIPIASIVLNLLSVGAACGVLTWIFQDGHLGGILGFTSYGGVVSWVPLFMFVLLFGLSMDYHIFILSRIRERVADGAAPRAAIVDGIGASAGVVTSAAIIMTAVFSVFVTLSAIEEKMLGVGMAVAVLIDATLVRGVLLPAAMSLLGRRAWTAPGWLDRLPGGPHRG